MGIYYRPFKKADLMAIDPIEPVPADKEFDDEMQQSIEDSGLSVTGVRDGKPVICGGVHPVNAEQGEVWVRISKDCLKYRVATLRSLNEAFAVIEQSFPFKQINAIVKCNFKIGVKLIEYLDFHLTQTRLHEGEKWLIFSKRVQA